MLLTIWLFPVVTLTSSLGIPCTPQHAFEFHIFAAAICSFRERLRRHVYIAKVDHPRAPAAF